MANELQRYAASQIVKSGESNLTTGQAVGGTMVKAGTVAGGVYLLAALVPFVSTGAVLLPLLLVLMVFGGYLRYFRG